jgi:hypothetical protein
MADQIISQEYLREIFNYKDGEFYWKNHKYKALNNKKVGGINGMGYHQLTINSKLYATHRLIFLFHYNFLPKTIDHIDGNKLNNKIENLREATLSQNQQNTKKHKDNTSGVKGITWHKFNKRWQVQMTVNGKNKYFGAYKDIDYAKFVIDAMRNKYHKEFANFG